VGAGIEAKCHRPDAHFPYGRLRHILGRRESVRIGWVRSMKKLIIAVVQNEDADAVVDALLDQDFRATRLASTGGFLRRGNTTLMIGADEDQVDSVLDMIRRNARSGAALQDETSAASPPAAATVFVLDLEEYQRL
jgi:uncharacterized protein YaaQ